MNRFVFSARSQFYKVRGFVQAGDRKICSQMLKERGYQSIRIETLQSPSSMLSLFGMTQEKGSPTLTGKRRAFFALFRILQVPILLLILFLALSAGLGWLHTKSLYEKLAREGFVTSGSITRTYQEEAATSKHHTSMASVFVYSFKDNQDRTVGGSIHQYLLDGSLKWGATSGVFDFSEYGGCPKMGDAIEVTYLKEDSHVHVPYRLSGNRRIRDRFDGQLLLGGFTALILLLYLFGMISVIMSFEQRVRNAPFIEKALARFDASPESEMILEESELGDSPSPEASK